MRTNESGLWRVIYMTHDLQSLEAAERMLTGEGFLVRREQHRSASGAGTLELLALPSEAQEARQLILEKGF